MKYTAIIMISLASLFTVAMPASAQTRLKDIATVQGVRGNVLTGIGLVAGLNGTGDGTGTPFTTQAVTSMLQKFNIAVSAANQSSMQLKNVAAVTVTATLDAYAKNGNTIDVTVSSMGDAKSLQGGVLLPTSLMALDGTGIVYAVAQGAVSIGGFSAGGAGGSTVKNHPTVGRIPGGGTVEQDVPTTLAGASGSTVSVTLDQADFTTAAHVADAVRGNLPPGSVSARAVDARTIQIAFTPGADMVTLIGTLEDLPITTDASSKIVINERTGTVVMGGAATVSACAVAHGDLTVNIKVDTAASQPSAFSKTGDTKIVKNNVVTAQEDTKARLIPVPTSLTIDKVVRSLNALGVTPRDLIAILQMMKEAGALHADLEIQ